MMLCALAKIYIIVQITATLVRCENVIYVSLHFGNNNIKCGSQQSPCRTISYGTHQASEGSLIYLDGTSTSKHPYNCQSFDLKHPGIHLTQSMSFVSIKSRAYISCLQGNQWSVDGTKHKDGLRVHFSGLAFKNMSLRFENTLVTVNDCVFEDSNTVAMNITLSNLARYDLTMNNVVFQRNTVCMMVGSNTPTKIFVRITNSSFMENGYGDSPFAFFPSIFWLSSIKDDIQMNFKNCTFKKNEFKEYGMIVVGNKPGTTNLSLDHFKFDENREIISGIKSGLLYLLSARTIIKLQFGFISSTWSNFLYLTGQSLQFYVSNIEVVGFYNPDEGGGVFAIETIENVSLSIQDSSFRHGGSTTYGGALSVTTSNIIMIVHNCTFHNVTSIMRGGAIYVQSPIFKWPPKSAVAEVKIVNSSFSDNVSQRGGAVCTDVENLYATITDTLFVRNRAINSGGALMLKVVKTASIHFQNVHFSQNSAGFGGIVTANIQFKQSILHFKTDNVSFVKNKLHAGGQNGVLFLSGYEHKQSNIVLTHTSFSENIGVNASVVFILSIARSETFDFIMLDNCVFRENIVDHGALMVSGQGKLICKDLKMESTSNTYATKESYRAFAVAMNNSVVTITNSRFYNNSPGAMGIVLNRNSVFKIEESIFFQNWNLIGSGAAMSIHFPNHANNSNSSSKNKQANIIIKGVFFQENVASSASVMTVSNGIVDIVNCTFLNNFARTEQGGQISSVGSSDTRIYTSVFKQTFQKALLNSTIEYIATSFLRLHNPGDLYLHHTTMESNVSIHGPYILATKASGIKIDNSSVTKCPMGFAMKTSYYSYEDSDLRFYTFLDFSCQKCEYGFYSLQRGKSKGMQVNDSFKCTSCPRGADCLPPTIKSKSNFWGYEEISDSPTLAFTLCPFGYCKSDETEGNTYNECHGKRTGVMCGSCSDGYTEALWSSRCTAIDDCNDNWYWIVFVIQVFLLATILVFKPPFVAYSLRYIFWFKRTIPRRNSHRYSLFRMNTDEEATPNCTTVSGQFEHDKNQFPSFLDIIFYFYQIAQLLLSSYSLGEFFDTKFLPSVLGFFNFDPTFTKHDFVCPFPGLTPKTKLLFKTLPVFGTMIAIFTTYLLHLLISKLTRARLPSSSPYIQASIKTVFLGYVTMATVSFSLIRCVSIAGKDRWFYNGNVTCYQWWQYASFVFNGIFVTPLIFVLAWAAFKLHHNTITFKQFLLAIIFPLPLLLFWLFRAICPSNEVDIEECQKLKAVKELLLGPYRNPGIESKCGALYWQSVLIARRFILVLLFCTVTEPSIRIFSMTLACVLVFSCHLMAKPFQNSSVNILESFSLLLLIILGLINLFKSAFVGNEENIKGSLVTAFTVLQWLEVVILGLLPALLSLFLSLAAVSLLFRILCVCCRFFFKLILRCFAKGQVPHHSTCLINVSEEIYE